ncbi:MAG: hypothetical protein ACI4BH_07470 [Muribaculaceae bacterium]
MKHLLSLIVSVALSAPCIAAQSLEQSPVEEIIVITKTHFDIGYTHRVSEIVHHYQTDMIDHALDAMDQSMSLPKEQQYAWTIPGWVLSKVMENWDGQSEERRRRLDERFRSQQLICHSMPFTLISEMSGVEDMARGMAFSANLNRSYGFPLSRSGKMTDEPSHCGALATVLANAGVKFLHIGCNWPSGFVDTPGLFWWEGPDGSRVLTLYSASYGTNTAVCPKNWVGPNDPFIGDELLPAKDWKYKVWPAILVTGDNSGPASAQRIKELFDDAHKRMPGVKVRMGTMDDFYDAIISSNAQIPVLKTEMPDTWVHGAMCDPRGISLSRHSRSLIASAEMLCTHLSCMGIDMPDISEDVAKVFENILLYDEHTWGGAQSVDVYGDAFKQLPADRYKSLEASWDDKSNYIRQAAYSSQDLIDADLDSLAANVKCSRHSLLIFNPLPYKRSGWVAYGSNMVYAADIPACGYKTISFPSADYTHNARTANNSIENEHFSITFDPDKGAIVSLIDKNSGREWVDANSPIGFGQYLNERFTYEQTVKYCADYQQGRAGDWIHPGMHKPGMISEKDVPYRAASPHGASITITVSASSQSAELLFPADPKNHIPASKLTVTLYRQQPYIDMALTIIDKEKDNWPEADWFCLPFNISNPQFGVYRQLGIMNPATDIQKGANRHLYSADYGVKVVGDDGCGFAICPIDHPLISLGEPGCWKFSNTYSPEKPIVYINLYNNQWNTNFRYWYTGSWTSRVRLWAIDHQTDSQFITNAIEARNPLIAKVIKPNHGTLPNKQSGIGISRKGIIVTAFGADYNGSNGTLLRVWEQAGESGAINITLPRGLKASSAQPVDLRGEPIGDALPISNGRIHTSIHAYAPLSFVIR